MKKIFVAILSVVLFYSCSNDNEKRISELEQLIEEYRTNEAEHAKTISDFGSQLEQFGNIQDSLRYYENCIDSLKAEIKAKRKASKADNETLNAMLAQIDSYLSKNKELAETIQAKDFKGKNERQIVNLLLKSLEDKEKQIAMMKEEIDNLNQQVAGLTVANRNLTTSLTQTQADLIASNKTIDEQNRQIATAKSLTLSNLNVKLPQGVLGSEKKAKKIENLDFCFTVNKNELADNQTVTIYIRVTNSRGNLLKTSDNNLFNSEEGQIGYTVKKSVTYAGKALTDCISWNPGKGTLKSGSYIATYYINDRKVDQKTFIMK